MGQKTKNILIVFKAGECVVVSLRLWNVFLGQRLEEIFPEFVLLLAVRQGLNGAKAVNDIPRLAEVDLVQRIAEKKSKDSIKMLLLLNY
jgi:hypothetical protein